MNVAFTSAPHFMEELRLAARGEHRPIMRCTVEAVEGIGYTDVVLIAGFVNDGGSLCEATLDCGRFWVGGPAVSLDAARSGESELRELCESLGIEIRGGRWQPRA